MSGQGAKQRNMDEKALIFMGAELVFEETALLLVNFP
jgi:hypothetical protein